MEAKRGLIIGDRPCWYRVNVALVAPLLDLALKNFESSYISFFIYDIEVKPCGSDHPV